MKGVQITALTPNGEVRLREWCKQEKNFIIESQIPLIVLFTHRMGWAIKAGTPRAELVKASVEETLYLPKTGAQKGDFKVEVI